MNAALPIWSAERNASIRSERLALKYMDTISPEQATSSGSRFSVSASDDAKLCNNDEY